MNESSINHKRLFIFGTVSGLLWSLVPGYLSELMYHPRTASLNTSLHQLKLV